MADGQAEATAVPWRLAGRFHLGEGLQQALALLWGNADAGVQHPQQQVEVPGARRRQQLQLDLHLALSGELEGIAQQVGQDLLETQAIYQ